LLPTVCAFANTAGGTLVVGLEAKDGVPQALAPLQGRNPDADKAAIESLVADRTEPVIRFHVESIKTLNGPIYLLDVPKSWAGPHAVRYGKSYTCYVRTSAGNLQLDFMEIRNRAVAADAAPEQAWQFRTDRVRKFLTKDVGFTFGGESACIIHFCPLECFTPGYSVPLNRIRTMDHTLPVCHDAAASERPTLNGYLRFVNYPTKPLAYYTEVHRNGCVESMITDPTYSMPGAPNRLFLSGQHIATALVDYFPRFLAVYRHLGVNPPVALMLTLTGMAKLDLQSTHPMATRAPLEVTNDVMVFPEILIEDFAVPASVIVRPALEMLWNAWGYTGCPFYDRAGNFKVSGYWQ
jgi:hypothetical protein